jgi:hypothetical protein
MKPDKRIMHYRVHREMKMGCVAFLALVILVANSDSGLCNELRVWTLGNQRIALTDEDNQVNPYDLGRNPAYLLLDFELPWSRFAFGGSNESGDPLRPFDAGTEKLAYGTAAGRKKLGDRHAIMGGFSYHGRWQDDVSRSLEEDPYNDPFYLTDQTTGNFEYFGPSTSVDYSLRLTSKFYLGAGFDYRLSTGLKQEYTRPEIVHNYLRGNFGVIYKPAAVMNFGLFARPVRLQNRTEFARNDEGFDNIIYRYSGDGIYEIRAYSSYTIREVLNGVETGAQGFLTTRRLQLGAILTYELNEIDIRYGSSTREHLGLWQSTKFDLELISRYTPEGSPLTLGLRGRVMRDDGWAKRPEYDNVLLYDNPVRLESVGGGATLRLPSGGPLLAGEYVMNHYRVTVHDYGAQLHRSADVVQQVARLGMEYDLFALHSLRAGAEARDYLIDRQLLTPPNVDRYRFSAGFRYRTGYWDIETQLVYDYYTQSVVELERSGLGFIVWFSHM